MMQQEALIKGLALMMTDEEYDDVMACASERGVGFAEMCRQAILDDIAR